MQVSFCDMLDELRFVHNSLPSVGRNVLTINAQP